MYIPVYNIIVEVSPVLTEREGLPSMKELLDMFADLFKLGYKAYKVFI